MSSVSRTGSASAAAASTSVAGTSSSSAPISPEEIQNALAADINRVDQAAYQAGHPGFWTRFKDHFDSADAKSRAQQVADAAKFDQIFQQLYALVANIYQAMIDPSANMELPSAQVSSTTSSTSIA